MKTVLKKAVLVLISAVLLIGSFPGSFIPSFATEKEPETVEIDISNPFSYKLPDSLTKKSASSPAKAPSRAAKSAPSLPSQYDSRYFGFVTPVRNQGNTGTCWAHATMAAIESYELASGISGPDINYSESHLTWFTHNPKDESGLSNAKDGTNLGAEAYDYGGNRMDAAIALANTQGINNDDDYPLYPYEDTQYPFSEEDRYTHTSGRGIKDVVFLEDTNEIKQAIMTSGAVTASFCYATQFEKSATESGHMYYSYYCDTAYQSNHAVTAVGWDDFYPASRFKTDPGQDGAWLIKDSWGTFSKDNGYFWISYADASLGEFTSFSSLSLEDNYKNYSYTAISPVRLRSCTKYANIYTSSGYELISEVGILNFTAEADYTVKIYKNPSASNPESGTLIGSASRYLKNTGYYTFEFSGVSLEPGDRFSVVVSASSSETFWVALESSEAGEYVANTGESFRFNGARWLDSVSEGYGNAYVFVNTECSHRLTYETSESTCTSHGHTLSRCSQCGRSEETELPLAAHNYITQTTYAPNETVKFRKCLNCGETEILSRSAVMKTVTLADFLQRLFDLIFSSLYKWKIGR